MSDTNNELYELSVSRHIAATPEQVWQVMTKRMPEWWCPKPWRIEIVEMDWRAGGRSAMVMLGPEGEELLQEGVFLEVTPGKCFVITDAINVKHIPQNPFMIGIWGIEAENNGTRYTARARHWNKEAYVQHQEMGFKDGWEACANQLAAICETEQE